MKKFFLSASLLVLSLMLSFALVNSAYSVTLWYNGDWDGYFELHVIFPDISPDIDTYTDAMIYDDFNVPSQGWEIDTLWANYHMNFSVTDVFWEIRSGVSTGDGGTVIANATTHPSYSFTQTLLYDSTVSDVDRYGLEITGLDILLSEGTYWLAVTPIAPGSSDEIALLLATSGTNAIGTPPGNNANSFIDGISWGTSYNFASIEGNPDFQGFEDPDFSMRIGGTVPVPEPATMLLLGTGLIGLVGFKRKFRK